jgi:hypothetical protein
MGGYTIQNGTVEIYIYIYIYIYIERERERERGNQKKPLEQ